MTTLAELNRHATAYAETTYLDANDPRRDDPAEVDRITHESNRQAQYLADGFITSGITGTVEASADLLSGALDTDDPVYLRNIARQVVRDLRALLGANDG